MNQRMENSRLSFAVSRMLRWPSVSGGGDMVLNTSFGCSSLPSNLVWEAHRGSSGLSSVDSLRILLYRFRT